MQLGELQSVVVESLPDVSDLPVVEVLDVRDFGRLGLLDRPDGSV